LLLIYNQKYLAVGDKNSLWGGRVNKICPNMTQLVDIHVINCLKSQVQCFQCRFYWTSVFSSTMKKIGADPSRRFREKEKKKRLTPTHSNSEKMTLLVTLRQNFRFLILLSSLGIWTNFW